VIGQSDRFAQACRVLALAVLLALVMPVLFAQTDAPVRWDKQTLKSFSTIPIQDAGRIKPLSTFADFKLIQFNGKRSCKDATGRKITAMEWLLTCFFFQEEAKAFKVFRVDNAAVLDLVGIAHIKKRDSYSFQEISQAEEKLLNKTKEFYNIQEASRTSVQSQTIRLYHNYTECRQLFDVFAFARMEVDKEVFALVFDGKVDTKTPFSDMLRHSEKLKQIFNTLMNAEGADENETRKKSLDALNVFARRFSTVAQQSAVLAVIPPASSSKVRETWYTPSDMFDAAFSSHTHIHAEIEVLAGLERLDAYKHDPAAFQGELEKLHQLIRSMAEDRDEYNKIELEFLFYGLKLFPYSLVLYILSFVIIAFGWLRPNAKWLYRAGLISVIVPTVLLCAGIIFRCVLRGRPPVTNLFETILFCTAACALLAVFIECVNKQRIALGAASVMGMVGIFIANKYELKDGVDTMESMVAVLNSNFWLATHVVTISIGYSAGLLAGVVAHVYIFAKVLNLNKDQAFYRAIARMVWGIVCFGLFFSFLGTVLGGIWANESWGRFWGWDPKENGALLIVLWCLAIMHARFGGYIRDLGLCAAAVFGAVIVVFSWWGVNLLNVGLHTYGFAEGIQGKLRVFYVIEGIVLLLAAIAGWRKNSVSLPDPDIKSEAQ